MGPDRVRQLRAALMRFPPSHVRFPPRSMMIPSSEVEWARLAPWAAWNCMPVRPVRDDRQISLLVTRQHRPEGPWAHVMATCHPAESSALDPFEIASQFPLYIYPDPPDPRAQGQLSLGLGWAEEAAT